MKVKIDKLDTLCSEYIRKRAITEVGGCERCLTPKRDIVKDNGSIYPAWKQLQTCHFHSRRKHSVRYDPDNLVACCFGCHQYLDSHAQEKIDFFKQRLGERDFDLLTARANSSEKADKELIGLYLKNLIKEMEK